MTKNLKALDRSETLTDRVAGAIQEMLISGALEPGERLNEATLADKLAVSRGPVREATRALAGAGLLTVIPGRGVFVRRMSNKEIDENYDVRALLTGFICSRAAERRTEVEIAELSNLVEQMELAFSEGRIADYYRVNIIFHDTIGRIANHSSSNRIYNDIVDNTLIREIHNLRRSLAIPLQTNDEHRKLVDAIRLGDIEMARQCGEEHVLNGKERWKASLLE
ncbi:MAG: GntR family transcriptional regulator [Desulfuromusa sp.]|nr:GntR family transcriptional regulator [Desulfuromusa sp.]